MSRLSWDEYFMTLAKITAMRSTCLSRPVGAVIIKDKQVLSTGYNGNLPGFEHCIDRGVCFRRETHTSEEVKYDVCKSSHAEANAITLAAKKGIPLEGSTLYCTLQPCFTCSKLIVMAGIKEVFYELEYKSTNEQQDEYWKKILIDSNIVVRHFKIERDIKISLQEETSKRRL